MKTLLIKIQNTETKTIQGRFHFRRGFKERE